VEREQVAALRLVKERRDRAEVRRALDEVRRAASGGANLMPSLLDAARARVTVGEVMNALADVFGRYDGAAIW
jgi:methylmalonyl-CoA mutase, N-terminal domain